MLDPVFRNLIKSLKVGLMFSGAFWSIILILAEVFSSPAEDVPAEVDGIMYANMRILASFIVLVPSLVAFILLSFDNTKKIKKGKQK